MTKIETPKKMRPANVLRALRFGNVFGKPSSLEEGAQLNSQGSDSSFNTWIERKHASLDAERTKAESLLFQREQRFV